MVQTRGMVLRVRMHGHVHVSCYSGTQVHAQCATGLTKLCDMGAHARITLSLNDIHVNRQLPAVDLPSDEEDAVDTLSVASAHTSRTPSASRTRAQRTHTSPLSDSESREYAGSKTHIQFAFADASSMNQGCVWQELGCTIRGSHCHNNPHATQHPAWAPHTTS